MVRISVGIEDVQDILDDLDADWQRSEKASVPRIYTDLRG